MGSPLSPRHIGFFIEMSRSGVGDKGAGTYLMLWISHMLTLISPFTITRLHLDRPDMDDNNDNIEQKGK